MRSTGNAQPTNDDSKTVDLMMYRVGRLSHSELMPDRLTPGADNRTWDIVLREPWLIEFDDHRFLVPIGFIFDGASVRYRWVNMWIQRYGRDILPPACLHDYFYSDGRHLIPEGVGDQRLWCDRLFYAALRACGVNLARAQAAYRAVRMFGGRVWDAGTQLGYDLAHVTKESILLNTSKERGDVAV